ncbi:MAG TPA: FHA domain-containing protein [Myxococcota bacterium]|nr:FHA domain-containing protein [Myxococcota bacterium]HQK50464.1 FHA domain-containing protein [Myxococcota bacterium]
MLKVTVAEKGGLEHEHLFDVTAVTIGRVQGNLIVLPKPNVSKRHAMVQVEGGSVVLTDLKSTNGTYVNGRRITGPRQLSPEDRVYIGDYILRFSEVQGTTGVHEPTPLPPPPEDLAQYRATVAMPALTVEPPPPPPEASQPDVPVPLDLEVEVEAPPSQESVEQPVTSRVAPTTPSAVPPPPPPAEKPSPSPEVSVSVPSRLSAVSRRPATAQDLSAPERYVKALGLLAEAAAGTVFAGIDPTTQEITDEVWQRLSNGVMRLVDHLRREGRIGPDVDPYEVTQDLLYEFLGLGPFEELLADETIHGMMTIGREQVFVCRGDRVDRVVRGFSSQRGQDRVLERLANLAGVSREALGQASVQAALLEGFSLQVVNPPVAVGGRVIRLERCVLRHPAWSEWVSEGRVPEPEADLLRQAVLDRQGVALAGGTPAQRRAFALALLGTLPGNFRVVVLDGGPGGADAGSGVIRLDRRALAAMGPAAAALLASLRPDLVVAVDLEVDDLPLLARQSLAGSGLLAGWSADDGDSSPAALLDTMLMLAIPGLPENGARSMARRMVRQVARLESDPAGGCRLASLRTPG